MLSKANSAFGRLRKKAWDRRGISQDTNLKVYMAVVLTVLLCARESWTVYSRHARNPNHYHAKCGICWALSGKTWSPTPKSSHEQASLAFALYCRKLKWDEEATWHGCLMTACQNSYYMVSSATANNQFVGKRNAWRTPLKVIHKLQHWCDQLGSMCPGSTPMAPYDSYRSKKSINNHDRGGSEKARCSQSETLLSHHHLNRPDIPMPRKWKSASCPNWTN